MFYNCNISDYSFEKIISNYFEEERFIAIAILFDSLQYLTQKNHIHASWLVISTSCRTLDNI